MSYQALLVAPDGDYITDYHFETKEEVLNRLADRGSEWFFYPFEFVVTDKMGRILEAPPELAFFKGKNVQTVIKTFKEAYKIAQEKVNKTGDDIDLFEYIDLVKNIFIVRRVNHD